MPDVVRLRNNHGHPVEVDHVPGPNPDHGDVVDVPGRLVTDVDEYRQLMGLAADVPLGADVAGYAWILGADGQLRGWPREVWEFVEDAPPGDAPSTVDTKAKGK
jgi:hypothetical protein